jgi:hypothetical protein
MEMDEKMNHSDSFPAYRKYKGINVWFKVIDARHFIEIKQIGSKFVRHEVEALQYPEMMLIQDIVNCADDRWEVIEVDVYMSIEKNLIIN